MESKKYWEGISNEYADEILKIQPQFYYNSAILINGSLTNCYKVLDVGNGGVINYDFSSIKELVCMDIHTSFDTISKFQKFPNIRFVEGNILEKTYFGDEEFDAIVIQTVLHHLAGKSFAETEKNIEKALKECARIIKKNGKIVIVESTISSLFERLEKIFYSTMQLIFDLIKFDNVYQYSRKSLERKIESLDFVIVHKEEVKLDKYVWLLKFKIPTFLTPLGAMYFEISKK